MATDAMFKLEHKSDDVDRGKKVLSNLGMLEVRRDEWKDDYILNKIARNKFRVSGVDKLFDYKYDYLKKSVFHQFGTIKLKKNIIYKLFFSYTDFKWKN